MSKIEFVPIGTVHSPFDEPIGVPIQPSFSSEKGYIELEEEYLDAIKDLDGFSHIVLLYHFHKSNGYKLRVKPFLDNEERGLFSTRAPRRPNGIGLSVVKLDRIDGNRIYIDNVDIVNNTPLLDIKPYVDVFDEREEVRYGWLENARNNPERRQADTRFSKHDEK